MILMLVSKKEQYGKNNSFIYYISIMPYYIIGYNDKDVIRPLCLKL